MKLHYLSLLLPQFLQTFYLSKMTYLIKSFYYGYFKNKRNVSTFDHNWNGININRHAIINKGIFHINKIKNECNYLEIGCHKDQNFNSIALNQKFKTGVDPAKGGTIRETSDAFFKSNKKKFDVIFIDGLHHYLQCQKDIINSINAINDFGIIFIHDLLPRDWKIEHVPRCNVAWCGDVWKVAIELNKSSNVDFYIADIDSGVGCAFVNKKSGYLDMSNELKNKNYQYFLDNIRECNLIHPDNLLDIISKYDFNSK